MNAGANLQGNQVPPQVQAAANDQVMVNRSAMTDGEVREALLQIAQSSTTKA